MLTIEKKQTMKYKMIECRSCGGDMPELRLTQYGYNFCVTCSENGKGEGMKHGIPVLMGEGDHTWVETIIMDDDQYQQYQRQENAVKNLDKNGKAEMQDMDDDKNLHGPITIKDANGK
jgi:hypothetical protein|tara:strand:- start:1149 stop:1502 length:354 start_codon:yes stop_codon:yes gene_type:complete